MLDFRELHKNGNTFELLIREILFELGFTVHWTGKGPDGGIDLLCIENYNSIFLNSHRKWLVQCKHTAHSENAVGINDLGAIVDTCIQHEATGYLLVCSTYPSSAVVSQLEKISINDSYPIIATYWDSVKIERFLKSPKTWSIAQRFFPNSSKAEDWIIYATERPNHWIANHKGYHIHLSNRISSSNKHHLETIDLFIKKIESISLHKEYFLRLRAVYYDDKHGEYTWYLDYLFPNNFSPKLSKKQLQSILGNKQIIDGQHFNIDILFYTYAPGSDHFDKDHYDYYNRFINFFCFGESREDPYYDYEIPNIYNSKSNNIILSNFKNLTSSEENPFKQLLNTLNSLDYIEIINAKDSSIEDIYNFYSDNDYVDTSIEPSNFLSAEIIFNCSDKEKLHYLLLEIPLYPDKLFDFYKRYIYTPDGSNGSYTYHLIFSIQPYNIIPISEIRILFNEYFSEINTIIKKFIDNELK